MKNELTAKRIQLALTNSNMKSQELSDRSGIGKSSISQYVNGSHAPGNVSAERMGKILNVNPLWLMGFDVPMERSNMNATKKESPEIITYYDQLNNTGKEAATEQVRLLTLDEKYTRPDKITQITGKPLEDPYQVSAAHENPDATKEDKQFDEDLMDNDEIWS